MKQRIKRVFTKQLMRLVGIYSTILAILIGISGCQSLRAEPEAKTLTLTDIEALLNCKSTFMQYTEAYSQLQFKKRIGFDDVTATAHDTQHTERADALNLPYYAEYNLSQPITVDAGYPAQFFRKPPPHSQKVERPPRKPDTFVSSHIGIGHNRIVAYVDAKPSHVIYSLNTKAVNFKKAPYFLEASKIVDTETQNMATPNSHDADSLEVPFRASRYAASQSNDPSKSVLGCEYHIGRK